MHFAMLMDFHGYLPLICADQMPPVLPYWI